MSLYSDDWKPWGKRRRYRLKWGDPDVLETRSGEIGCYLDSEKLIVLHPHLRRQEHHDLKYDTLGHECVHAAFPNWPEAKVLRLERVVGQLIHDLAGCRKCPG